jgi:hypothetical protein
MLYAAFALTVSVTPALAVNVDEMRAALQSKVCQRDMPMADFDLASCNDKADGWEKTICQQQVMAGMEVAREYNAFVMHCASEQKPIEPLRAPPKTAVPAAPVPHHSALGDALSEAKARPQDTGREEELNADFQKSKAEIDELQRQNAIHRAEVAQQIARQQAAQRAAAYRYQMMVNQYNAWVSNYNAQWRNYYQARPTYSAPAYRAPAPAPRYYTAPAPRYNIGPSGTGCQFAGCASK